MSMLDADAKALFETTNPGRTWDIVFVERGVEPVPVAASEAERESYRGIAGALTDDHGSSLS